LPPGNSQGRPLHGKFKKKTQETEEKMTELVIFYCTVETRLAEQKYVFTGIGSDTNDAYKRAIKNMEDDEYLNCVHYAIVRICYGIM
jgi:hypothetical protein